MSKYELKFDLAQSTDGEADGVTSVLENSEDLGIHLIKVKVFTKHLTAALGAITEELCDLGLDALNVSTTSKGKGKR